MEKDLRKLDRQTQHEILDYMDNQIAAAESLGSLASHLDMTRRVYGAIEWVSIAFCAGWKITGLSCL